jgi:hypothetical protein
MKIIDQRGRCIPAPGMRVFQANQGDYYTIKLPTIDFESIFSRLQKFNNLSNNFNLNEFVERSANLLAIIRTSENYANLLKGPHVPFVIDNNSDLTDLGGNLEDYLLPNLHKSFLDMFPDRHFKSVNQVGGSLKGKIHIEKNSRYEKLLHPSQNRPVVGWYFPQALQEFDIESQRLQINQLPELPNAHFCLSGALEVCASLIGLPNLLINEDSYSPILCLSSYVHEDPRLVCLLKAYGPHMEFWCMSQMLTSKVTQVSEQWSGGISIFD